MAMFGARAPAISADAIGAPINTGQPDFSGMTAAPQVKPRFFGEGGTGRAMLGGLFDSIISQTGGGTPNRDNMLMQRQQEMLEQQAQLKRSQDYRDWVAKKQWELENPPPEKPTELQRNTEYLNTYRPGLGDQYANNRANPIQGVPITNPDGSTGIQFIRPGGGGAGAEAPSQGGGGGGEFADFNGASRMIQSMGPQQFVQWQQQFGTPVQVSTPEQMSALPSGTLMMGPGGEVRRKP